MRDDEAETTEYALDAFIADGASGADGAGGDGAGDNGAGDDGAEGDAGDDTSRVSGWRRILRGNRVLWIVALCAVLSLVAGLLIGRFLISPADAHGDAPAPGLVTVPVEFGPLSNDVTLRADVGYADAVEVSIDTASVPGSPVVTGQVPEVGATLTPLSVALEIAGRPVIVLPGELPAYRTLRIGVSGPDVLQLKQALVSVGIDPGDVGSNLFDEATATALTALYAQAGYPVPTADEGAAESVRAAQDSLASAQAGVSQAQQALNAAGAGPTALESWQAEVRVAEAEDALAAAHASGVAVAQAERDLQTARLERDQLWSGRDTTAEKAAVEAARSQVDAARQALESARQGALTFLPSSEVLYLTELPRRVDAVAVKRGAVVSGAVMTVSGATVRLSGAAAEADARLLSVGDAGTFELPDGTEHAAAISELLPGKDGKARWEVRFEPDPLTSEQIQQLQGNNVRIRVAVGATDGDVLSVPLAALSAGPGGESRVDVVESDPREGKDARTRTVVVKTGLAARGAVEVTPLEGELDEGDLVVVGG